MRFAIRDATSADQDVITALQYEAFFVPDGSEPFPRSILDEPDIRPYHAAFGSRHGDVGKVAVESGDGRPIGAAWVRLHDPARPGFGFVDADTPELGIAVVAEARGSGVGTALLASLTRCVPRMSLSVDERNPARRLYERTGFTIDRRVPPHSIVMLRAGDPS